MNEFRATLTVQPAFAEIPDLHGSANMFDFSGKAAFRFIGDIFIAETGYIPTGTGALSFAATVVADVEDAKATAAIFSRPPSYKFVGRRRDPPFAHR